MSSNSQLVTLPMHIACEHGHSELAILLLDHAAMSETIDTNESANDLAVANGRMELAKQLRLRIYVRARRVVFNSGWLAEKRCG